MRFVKNTKSYFVISKGQRNAIMLLFAMLLVMIITYFLLPYFLQPDYGEIRSFEEEAARFAASAVAEQPDARELTPFAFDPNKADSAQFVALGLNERQSEMIIRYRNAGGKFRTAEDFGKIFSISEEEYLTLKPFITIEPPEEKPKIVADVEPDKKFTPFAFDPNLADSAEMSKMGFRKAQINNIINYRNAGGTFRVKSDLQKLFTISEDDYAALEKFILLPAADTAIIRETPVEVIPVIVEINSADTAQLQLLSGIGPVFAQRIVTYRDRLGGFYDKSQLLEVFGMDTARYAQISGNIETNPAMIQKMDLNRTSFREMVAHPYLEYYIVKSIFEYKDAAGGYDSVAELKQINLIYSQLYNKLKHYFTVNDQEEISSN